MKTKQIGLSLVALLSLTGCFKDVSHKTSYILKPLAQERSTSQYEAVEGLKAYAFPVDTVNYTVASYEDALQGIITSKENPSERIDTPAATAEPYEHEGAQGWMQMTLTRPSQMVVAVNPVYKVYAYTQQQLGDNLPKLYVSLVFKRWKEGFSYQDGAWSFYDRFYVPPVEQECYLEPALQAAQDAPSTEISNLKAYAYAVDTTSWYVASYDDAVAGRLLPKRGEAEPLTNPDFSAYQEEGSSRYKMQLSGRKEKLTLMVVVVDRTDRLYAYSQQEIDMKGEPATLPLLFQPWREKWIYVNEQGWRVVDPSRAPQNPKPSSR